MRVVNSSKVVIESADYDRLLLFDLNRFTYVSHSADDIVDMWVLFKNGL